MKNEEGWIDCEGTMLYGEVYLPDVLPAPAVLICHGMNARGFHLLKIYSHLARTACKHGYVSMLFDFRGLGRSTGEYDYGFKERQDVKCALGYLASRPEVTKDRIYVVGHSLGGAVSLYALQDETRVKGLVLWSVPKNHDYNVRKFIANTRGKRGLSTFLVYSKVDRILNVSRFFHLEVYGVRLRPRFVRDKLMKLNECEAVSQLKGIPLLVVNGEKDDIVGIDEAQEVYRHARDPKTLLIIESADHIYRRKEDELVEKTIAWIEKIESGSS